VFLKLKNNKWLLIFKIIKKKLLKILTFFAVRIYILMGVVCACVTCITPYIDRSFKFILLLK
jgi:hypothetical protein